MTPALILKSRIAAAIRGAFVADAASMGTHWIYNPAEMAKAVPSLEAPEFKNPPTPSFYSSEDFPGHYGPGALSPYGEQLLFVTEYLAKHGSVDGASMSKAMLGWADSFGGRPDSALKAFVENMKKEDGSGQWPNCGADDDQAHIYMKIVPVTCLYAGKPELQDKIVEAIKVHQNNAKSFAFGLASARILEAVLLGAPLEEALNTFLENFGLESLVQKEQVIEAFKRGKSSSTEFATLDELLLEVSHELMKDKSDSPFYDFAGRSCGLPQAFIGPVYLLYKSVHSEKGDEAYAKALRENILGSGDTCSRAIFTGAVLAASAPDTAPPDSWIQKVDPIVLAKIDAAANAIAEFATGSASKE